jgi:CGNR zinc finger protein
VDTDAYAEEAVRLVNHPVDSIDALRKLLAGRSWLRQRVRQADVKPFQQAQTALAAVVDSSAAGDLADAVAQLNILLLQHPIRPYISGHDAQSWHLHISDTDAPVAEIVTSEALFGLAVLVTTLGADRLGRCAAPNCGQAFLDTSPNRSRRFCSPRCATRVNVAAHRRRRQTQPNRRADSA